MTTDAEFWQTRWQRKEIGFHKDEVHPLSVPEAELKSRYGARCSVAKRHSAATLGMHTKVRAAGLQGLQKEAFLLAVGSRPREFAGNSAPGR